MAANVIKSQLAKQGRANFSGKTSRIWQGKELRVMLCLQEVHDTICMVFLAFAMAGASGQGTPPEGSPASVLASQPARF